MEEDDGEITDYVPAEDIYNEEEDEYDVEQRLAIGSGVELDIEADYQDINTQMKETEDEPVNDVLEEGEEVAEAGEGAEVEEVEEAEEKKPDEPQGEGACFTTCGPGGMLVVDPSHDTWPRDLSLYVLHTMYEVPLPDHAECLAVDALLRMCSLDFEVEQPPNVEYMSPSGRAPFIKCGRQLVSELDPILHHLSRKGVTLSGNLSEENVQKQQELWSLVQLSLSEAELRVCWLHPKTRRALTQPGLVGHQPWPLSYIIGREKRMRALAWLAAREADGTRASDLELSLDLVYKQVDDVCSTLSTELGDAPYFFGDKPTELAAMIYGHLYLLLTVPVPVEEPTSLSQVIQEYPNLVSLVARMDDEVFGRDLHLFLDA